MRIKGILVILLSLESSRVLSILGLFTSGPSLYLLDFISSPNTSRNHITTSTNKSLYIYIYIYIYIVLNVFKEVE